MTTKNCANDPKLVLKGLCKKSFVQNVRLPLEDVPGATDCFDELSDCFDGFEKGWLPSDEKLPCMVGLNVARSLFFFLMFYVYVYCSVI